MGSTRKKNQKKADFAKPKLKVGKSKAKPSNYTNVNFQSKGIVVADQSIGRGEHREQVYEHQMAMLKHHSHTTRKEALSYLYSHPAAPEATAMLIQRATPLIMDKSSQVRQALLKLIESIPLSVIIVHIKLVILHIHAGMTHISPDIRHDSTKLLLSLIKECPVEIVTHAWEKSIVCFLSLCGWNDEKRSTTIYGSRPNLSMYLDVLHELLKAGLSSDETAAKPIGFHPHLHKHLIPHSSSPYASLSLFSNVGSLKSTETPQQRRDVLVRYLNTLRKGLDEVRKGGGQEGRICKSIESLLFIK